MNYNEISPFLRSIVTYTATTERAHPVLMEKNVLYDYMVIYIEKGTATLLLDDCRYICRTNDILFLLPRQEYALANVSGGTVYHMIRFDMIYDEYSERISESIDVFTAVKNKTGFIREKAAPADWPVSLPVIRPGDAAGVMKLLGELHNLDKYRPDYYEIEMKILMLRLLLLILKESDGNTEAPKKYNKDSANSIFAVKRYIDEHVGQLLTLKDLSAKFNYNKYHLEKKFSKHFGVPITRYYNTLRIESAKEQLRKHKPVTQVAEALSFSSIYAFSRFFKRQVGVSPANFTAYEENNYQVKRRKYVLEDAKRHIPFDPAADYVEIVFYSDFKNGDKFCGGKAQFGMFYGIAAEVVDHQLNINYNPYQKKFIDGMDTFIPNVRVAAQDYSQVQLSFALQNFVVNADNAAFHWCSAIWGCYVKNYMNHLPDQPGDGIWFAFSSFSYIAVYGGSIGGWPYAFAKIPIPADFSQMQEATILCTDDYQIHLYITLPQENETERTQLFVGRVALTEEMISIYDGTDSLVFQGKNDIRSVRDGDHFVLFSHSSVTILDYVKILGA